MDQTKRIAVVTGGEGALGVSVVKALAAASFVVAVPVRGEEKPITGASYVRRSDLADTDDVRQFFENVRNDVGTIDALVNLVGGFSGGHLVEQTTDDELLAMFRLNVLTVHHAVREVVPLMKERRRGSIVNISAMPAIVPRGGCNAYSIAKGGVATLTKAIDMETTGFGITCNAIAPSIIRTAENERSMPDADFGTWVPPEEIAATIVFLCSEAARSISGNVISMFGGVR